MASGHAKVKIQNSNAMCHNSGVKVAAPCTPSWRAALCLHFAFCILHCGVLSAQQLLDRVLARVDGYPITLTDVQAAIGLGVIQLSEIGRAHV